MMTVRTKMFSGMLKAIAPIIPNKPTHKVLGNYLISSDGLTLSVTATDLEIFAQAIGYYEGVDIGRVAVSPAISKVVEKVTDSHIDLEFVGDTEDAETVDASACKSTAESQGSDSGNNGLKMTFNGGRAKYHFKGMLAHEFPNFPDEPIKASAIVKSSEFVAGLKLCKKFVSNDITKRVLTGIFFDGRQLVATDGHMIATQKLSSSIVKNEIKAVLPVSLLDVLSKVELPETITLEIAGEDMYQYIYIATPQLRIAARLIDSIYPSLDGIKYSNQPGFLCDRKQFLSAVNLHRDSKSKLRSEAWFTVKGNTLTISSGTGSQVISNKVNLRSGHPTNTKCIESQYFNPQKVKTILESIDSSEIRVSLGTNPEVTTFRTLPNSSVFCGLAELGSSAKIRQEFKEETVEVETETESSEIEPEPSISIQDEIASALSAIEEIMPESEPPTDSAVKTLDILEEFLQTAIAVLRSAIAP